MIIIFGFVFISYCIAILVLVYGFYKLKTPLLTKEKPKTTFSVIVPFKDEAEHLPYLFKSIEQLNYPIDLVEFILVNDHSEDDSVALAETFISQTNFQVKLMHCVKNSASPKKEALTNAIHNAKNEWIVTTDADCTFNPNWLNCFDAFIQTNNVKFIAGPVAYKASTSFLHQFQLLDFSSLIGVTIGSFGINKPLMCNGANLAFKKLLFEDLNGYQGNDTIASGDDVFLLEKALKQVKPNVMYLKHDEALVYTKPVNSLQALVAQRIRWASKTSKSLSVFPKLLGLLVLSTNALCIIACLELIIPIIPLQISVAYIVLKLLVDFWLIYKTLHFFKQQKAITFYALSALIYPFFSVYIAVLSLFGGYKWKNRRYKT